MKFKNLLDFYKQLFYNISNKKDVIIINDANTLTPANVIEYETDNIRNLIYTIRDKQVMLDSDVAMLYHYPTKRINETVKRNIERFPKNFCFQLTDTELINLRSQFATSSLEQENYGGRRYLIYRKNKQFCVKF